MLVRLGMAATEVTADLPTVVSAVTADSAALHLVQAAKAVLAVTQGTPTAA